MIVCGWNSTAILGVRLLCVSSQKEGVFRDHPQNALLGNGKCENVKRPNKGRTNSNCKGDFIEYKKWGHQRTNKNINDGHKCVRWPYIYNLSRTWNVVVVQ